MKGPSIIRSGWWVVLAGGGLTLIVGAVLVAPLLGHRPAGAPRSDFDLEGVRVQRELVVRAMNRDGVMALTEPAMIGAEEVDRVNREERGKLLVPDDRVIGVAVEGDARAYPLRLMRWHEVVNAVVGGEPLAITYSPLCDSVAVFSRALGGTEIELGVSGLLYNSNTLLYDRRAKPAHSPLWVQLTGRPVNGSGAAASYPRLAPRPASLTTWAEWRGRHPETTVLAPLPSMQQLYKRDPYHSYFGSDLLRFPVAPLPPAGGLALKERVVVLTVAGEDAAFPMSALAAVTGTRTGVYETTVRDVAVRIHFDADLGSAGVEPLGGPDGAEAVRYGFWFAWYSMEGTVPVMIRGAT